MRGVVGIDHHFRLFRLRPPYIGKLGDLHHLPHAVSCLRPTILHFLIFGFLQDALRDAFDEINAMRVPLDHEPFVLHINGSAFVAGLGQSSEEEHAGFVVYLGSTLMAAASAVGADDPRGVAADGAQVG